MIEVYFIVHDTERGDVSPHYRTYEQAERYIKKEAEPGRMYEIRKVFAKGDDRDFYDPSHSSFAYTQVDSPPSYNITIPISISDRSEVKKDE